MLIILCIAFLGIIFFMSGLLYDCFSNYYMRENLVTPVPTLSHKIKNFLVNSKNKFLNKRIDSDLLSSNIKKAFFCVTGKAIDEMPNYSSLILAIMILETGLRYHKKALPWIPISEKYFGAQTDGMMQAAKVPNPNFYINLVYNIQKLVKIVHVYAPDSNINDCNVKYVFADWCAGMYSCKIASLQLFLNKKLLPDPQLLPDGNLGRETAKTLIILKNYNDADDNAIIIDGFSKLIEKNVSKVEGLGECFINSNYYKNLVKEYPELNIPILSEAKVKSLVDKTRNKFSFSVGWLDSREYSEKAFLIYEKLNQIDAKYRHTGLEELGYES